jgi:hypothetical protein
LALLADKRSGAANHHRFEADNQWNPDLVACKTANNLPGFTPPQLTADQQEIEAIRRYNSGREHHWNITNPQTCEGTWIRQPILYDDRNYVNNVLAKSPSCP